MDGTRAMTQRESKECSPIEEKIRVMRMTLEEALYSKDARSKNVPIIKSLRYLIQLENEFEGLTKGNIGFDFLKRRGRRRGRYSNFA
jgi:hypothetical protein